MGTAVAPRGLTGETTADLGQSFKVFDLHSDEDLFVRLLHPLGSTLTAVAGRPAGPIAAAAHGWIAARAHNPPHFVGGADLGHDDAFGADVEDRLDVRHIAAADSHQRRRPTRMRCDQVGVTVS